MALEMRSKCEQCSRRLEFTSNAHICSYECTFCPTCTEAMNHTCPNCGGELVNRPKRKKP